MANQTAELRVKVEDHIGLVRAVVCKFVRKGRLEDSDLFSVGCLALMESAETYDPEKSKFCTWATRLIRQRVVDEYRRSKRTPRHDDAGLTEAPSRRPSDLPIHVVPRLMDRDPSDSKSERQSKEMLFAHYLDGKSLAQIGKGFGFSKEGVRKKIQSAVAAIRIKNLSKMEDCL